MPIARNGDIEICYETLGDPSGQPLLLVHGLGAQLIGWADEWCQAFVDAGRFVIRFDNRDAGLSTKLRGVTVDLPAVMAAWAGDGEMPVVPYLLSDMAADAVAVLDACGVERADVVGASLGGMIVQTIAIEHPDRVRTLTSIMSTTGEPAFYQSVPEVRAALLTAIPTDRDGAVAATVERSRLMSSTRYFDPEEAAARTGAAYDRMFFPEGTLRQTAAIRASGSRDAALRGLRVPTLVIHGRADTLILPIGGERTAELIPGANLLLVHDMGHDLPRPLWPLLTDAILSHTRHAIG
ncbi:MAG: alpha/beta hydrolase [Ilumatobacteraceae bacterium]